MIGGMSKPRDLTQSQWFHIVNRGADRQDIFSANSQRTCYQELVGETVDRSGIEVHAYAWMTNHTHMLVNVGEGDLPGAMRWLFGRYAVLYNGWTDRSGPVFTSRYFSQPILSDAQLAQTARYIHRNPLAFVPDAALVTYPWSSLGALCGRRAAPRWLSTGIVTADFTERSYLDYVLAPQPSDRRPLGDLPALTPTATTEIEQAIVAVTGITPDALWASDLRPTHARTLAVTLATEFRTATTPELARRYNVSDQRSVRRIARRGRTLATQSASFAHLRQRVITVLDAGRRAA